MAESRETNPGNRLEAFRPYLTALARLQIGARFRGKIDRSHVVQKTLWEGCRNWEDFRGRQDAELAAWLRRILADIIDSETGRTVQTLKNKAGDSDGYMMNTYGVSFSPDGSRLATAGADKTVRIWDTSSGRQLLVFRHANQVFDVKFGPDGRWLASGSGHWCVPRPGELRIWDGQFTATEP